MRTLQVAIVGKDPEARHAAAKAFDVAPGSWSVSLHGEAPDGFDALVLLPDTPGEGVRFDPDRPGSAVDELRSRFRDDAGPVGVWAPCPGAGATSVAVHLAAALAESTSCYLVDVDPLRGAALRVGCPPLDGDIDDPHLSARPVAGGFRLVEGELDDSLRDVASKVVVDGPWSAVLRAGCTKHAIVVPSGRAGIERAREVLSTIDAPSAAVIVNRTGWGGELTRGAIQRLLERRVALELPPSPGLRDAEDRNELLTSPFSPWLYRIRRLARAL
jgi:hypothetical protein